MNVSVQQHNDMQKGNNRPLNQKHSHLLGNDSSRSDALPQRTFEVNRMRENSSFIFICYVKTVPVYDFKLVWVVLYPSVRIFQNDLLYQQEQNNNVSL